MREQKRRQLRDVYDSIVMAQVPGKRMMHRRIASLLLMLSFAGEPVLSALGMASVSSDLPACCKKDGAHMCSMRRGQTKQDEGKPRLSAVCPFVGKTTLAVAGQRIQIAVGTRSTSAPVPASRVTAQAEVLVFASTAHFENWKRGPPSISLQS